MIFRNLSSVFWSSSRLQESRNHVCLIHHCKLRDLSVNKVWHIIDSIRTCQMLVNMMKNMSGYTGLSLSCPHWHPFLITSPYIFPFEGNRWAWIGDRPAFCTCHCSQQRISPTLQPQSLSQSTHIFWEEGWTKHGSVTWTEWFKKPT